jgi:hypothetical protein
MKILDRCLNGKVNKITNSVVNEIFREFSCVGELVGGDGVGPGPVPFVIFINDLPNILPE